MLIRMMYGMTGMKGSLVSSAMRIAWTDMLRSAGILIDELSRLGGTVCWISRAGHPSQGPTIIAGLSGRKGRSRHCPTCILRCRGARRGCMRRLGHPMVQMFASRIPVIHCIRSISVLAPSVGLRLSSAQGFGMPRREIRPSDCFSSFKLEKLFHSH